MSARDGSKITCWTPRWLESVTGGQWKGPAIPSDISLLGLGIDSRTITPGQVFLAIKGDAFDGHDYIPQAVNSGATFAIAERGAPGLARHAGMSILLVDNTLDALRQLAQDYRQRLSDSGCCVIGVVGSNGKTTTRHLIHTVLSSVYPCTQSPKSFNNHIGVPLTLLGASTTDRYLIAEVGTNHPGEIDELGQLLKPDAVVVTSIGHEHMEFFHSLEGVANEEAAITKYMTTDGPLFIQREAHRWITKADSFHKTPYITIFDADRAPTDQPGGLTLSGRRFTISESIEVELPLLAKHDVTNALAAVGVGRWTGIDDSQIRDALESVRPMPGRLVVRQLAGVTVIDDTYNANPDSVTAALEVLAEYPANPTARRIAVLGDMLELGGLSERAHRAVGQACIAMAGRGELDEVCLVGILMRQAYGLIAQHPGSLTASHYEDPVSANLESIALTPQPGDVVLCKGSRGLHLERLVDLIETRFNSDA